MQAGGSPSIAQSTPDGHREIRHRKPDPAYGNPDQVEFGSLDRAHGSVLSVGASRTAHPQGARGRMADISGRRKPPVLCDYDDIYAATLLISPTNVSNDYHQRSLWM